MAEANDSAPDDRSEAMLLGRALRALRERAGMSQAEAAEAMGYTSGEAWRVYEAGTAPTIFKPGVQFRLAHAVRATTGELHAERDRLAGRSQPQRAFAPPSEDQVLPIRDRVQAGAWLAADDTGQDQPRTYPAARDPRFPHAAQWLSEVLGDSMNELGIQQGDLVHCVDAVAIGYHPRIGDLVEVERLRAGGAERELTIKEIGLAPTGEWLLRPRSTNPRWKEPLPLGDGLAVNEDAEVRIRALVLASIRKF